MSDNIELTMSDNFGVWGMYETWAKGSLGNTFPDSFWMLHAWTLQSIEGYNLLFQWVPHFYSWRPFGMWFFDAGHTLWLLLGSILWSKEVLRTWEGPVHSWFKEWTHSASASHLRSYFWEVNWALQLVSFLFLWGLKIMPRTWPTIKLISRICVWKPK